MKTGNCDWCPAPTVLLARYSFGSNFLEHFLNRGVMQACPRHIDMLTDALRIVAERDRDSAP